MPRYSPPSAPIKNHSTLVRTSLGLVVALLLLLASWGAVHRVRGGAELPPPKWSEADLAPLPPDAENAWGVIGPLADMPDFTIDPALWDDSVPIPEDARANVDAELARPEVRALLARVPAVLERAYLSPPDTLADPRPAETLEDRRRRDVAHTAAIKKVVTLLEWQV